jgi:hypothetical protein
MAGTVQFGRLVHSTACCRLATRLETHGLTISWYSPIYPCANTSCAAAGGCLESAVYTNQLACAVGSVVLVYSLSHFKVYCVRCNQSSAVPPDVRLALRTTYWRHDAVCNAIYTGGGFLANKSWK